MTSPGQINAHLAGLTRGPDVTLIGDTAFPILKVVVPAYIDLRGNELYWSFTADDINQPTDYLLATDDIWIAADPRAIAESEISAQSPTLKDPTGLLDAFLQIENEAGIQRFAKAYGVLGLCVQGAPPKSDHRWGLYKLECIPTGWPNTAWHENVEHWMTFVKQFNAALKIAVSLHNGEPPKAADWDELPLLWPWEHKEISRQEIGTQCRVLAHMVDRWFQMSDIRPSFSWEQSGPNLSLTGSTFGILIGQLMFAISGGQALSICDGCGRAYLREGRKPQRGRRNFCSLCGDQVASKLRKRAQRVRERHE